MADVKLGIDATGARTGADEFIRQWKRVQAEVRAGGVGADGGASKAAIEQARASKLAADAMLQQARAATELSKQSLLQTRAATEAAKAEQLRARAQQQTAIASDRLAKEQERQLRVALTALSTLGDEGRAYAQLTNFHIRRTQAMGQEVRTSELLAAARVRLAAADEQANRVFSLGAVRARDLRSNMAALSRTMSGLAVAFGTVNPAIASASLGFGALQASFSTLPTQIAILAGVAAALGGIAKVGNEAAEGIRLTSAALETTGRNTGITISQVQEVATAMARSTGVSDEAVVNLTRSIVQFRGVTNETFPEIIRLAQDASERGFGSFEQNAKVIARIISTTQDASRAFKQLGVALSESQRSQIKNLAALGDESERTRLILSILNEEMGGAGVQAATTVAGSWSRFTEVLGDWIEEADQAIGASNLLRNTLNTLADAAAAVGPEAFTNGTVSLTTQLEESSRRQKGLRSAADDPGLPEFVRNRARLNLEKEINNEMVIRQKIMAEENAAIERQATAAQAASNRQKQRSIEDQAALDAIIKKEQARSAELVKFQQGMERIQRLQRDFEQSGGAIGIDFDEAVRQIGELEAATVGSARIKEADEKATRAQERAIREATEATKAYADALKQFREEEEAAGRAQEERLSDLKASNDLLAKEIEATRKGTEALAAFNVEKARALEIERQSDANVSDPAAVEESARGERLRQELEQVRSVAKANQQASVQSERVWDRAIDNIQQGFGDLFTNIVLQGKDAFNNIGDLAKQMISRIVGELGNAAIFKPLFNGLQNAVSGAGSSGGAGGGSFSNPLSILTGAIQSLTGVLKGGGGGSVASGTTFSRLPPGLPVSGSPLGGALSPGAAGASSFAGLGGSIASFGPAAGFAAAAVLTPMAIKNWVELFSGDLNKNEKTATIIGTSIGAAILGPWGAILGGAVAKLFAGTPSSNIGVGTAGSLAALRGRGLEGGFDISRETPFGFIGALGGSTSTNMRQTIEGSLDLIQSIDRQIAKLLTDTEEEAIRQLGLPDIGANVKRTSEKLAGQRIGSVLSALGIPQKTIDTLGLTTGTGEEQLGKATELLTTRREILDFLAKVNGTFEEMTESEQAIEKVKEMVDAIKIAGPAVGVLVDDLAALETQAIGKIREGFQKTIGDAILSLTDPATLAANQLAEQQAQRLREAEKLGADLVQVERLTGLERQRLLKEINDPIQSMIDAIQTSISGQSPTAALASAQGRFAEIQAGLRAGTGGFTTQDLSAAAQTLLGLGESLLGGPSFAAQRDEVLETLQSFLFNGTTSAADTSTSLNSLSFETARGNAANEALLNQLVTQNAQLVSEVATLNERLQRLENE